jgi:hypothetical protein
MRISRIYVYMLSMRRAQAWLSFKQTLIFHSVASDTSIYLVSRRLHTHTQAYATEQNSTHKRNITSRTYFD